MGAYRRFRFVCLNYSTLVRISKPNAKFSACNILVTYRWGGDIIISKIKFGLNRVGKTDLLSVKADFTFLRGGFDCPIRSRDSAKEAFMDKNMQEKLDVLSKKIGNTPVVSLGDGIYGKVEGNNPAGSVKDRAAFYMVLRALENGDLKEGGTIVEATSGNTGIGLSYVARELGLKAVMVMPESMSQQRRDMIAAYGAQLVLTPASEGMAGAVRKAKELAENGAWLANQFGNYASVEAHFYTTAPEIFSQVPTAKYVVAGVGSGGTAMGVKKYIEQNGIDCKMVAVEPLSSPLLTQGHAGSHKIQGIGANFVPAIVDPSKLDQIIDVADDDAIRTTGEIYHKFGIKCGISSGAAYFAAQTLRKQVEGDIVVVLPDNGERYPQSLYE